MEEKKTGGRSSDKLESLRCGPSGLGGRGTRAQMWGGSAILKTEVGRVHGQAREKEIWSEGCIGGWEP